MCVRVALCGNEGPAMRAADTMTHATYPLAESLHYHSQDRRKDKIPEIIGFVQPPTVPLHDIQRRLQSSSTIQLFDACLPCL